LILEKMSSVGDAEVAANEEDEEVQDLISAVKIVLKKALIHDGLARGLHESAKALDAKKAHVCFLAESCTELPYKRLVQGLCKEHKVPLIDVPDSEELGQWSGLCKIDKEGEPRKIVGASCVCVTDYGEESEALNFLQKHISTMTTPA